MGFRKRWTPSASQKREFAQKMQNDQEFANAYNERKELKAEKRRSGSKFDYSSAGGNYIPTDEQYNFAMNAVFTKEITQEQRLACDMVISGYSCQDKVHHDYIHVVNEMRRAIN